MEEEGEEEEKGRVEEAGFCSFFGVGRKGLERKRGSRVKKGAAYRRHVGPSELAWRGGWWGCEARERERGIASRRKDCAPPASREDCQPAPRLAGVAPVSSCSCSPRRAALAPAFSHNALVVFDETTAHTRESALAGALIPRPSSTGRPRSGLRTVRGRGLVLLRGPSFFFPHGRPSAPRAARLARFGRKQP